MSRRESELGWSSNRRPPVAKAAAKEKSGQSKAAAAPKSDAGGASQRTKLIVTALCLAGGLWAYWPTLVQLAVTWNKEPDYSHGFLVIPLALLFLWLRRSNFPGLEATSPVLAMVFMTMSMALRYIGDKYFFTFMDGWSIVPWAAAVAAAIGGRPLLWWCLPSIGFLIFMVPLPFRIEGELSAPLQRIATKLSTTGLQTLGQAAFDEGNVILLGDEKLEVAQACSGLRLFMSVIALTYAYITIIRRQWWEKLVLVLAVVPIAIFANSARIVATGLIYEWTTSEAVRRVAHDSAGWAMVLFAASVFGLLLWYLRVLFREEQTLDMASIVRRARI